MASDTKGSAEDIQVGGDWYNRMKIQVTRFTWANGLDGIQHSVVKYVCRFRHKDGLQDLLKAKHYIDLLIEYEYPDGDKENGDPRIHRRVLPEVPCVTESEEAAGSAEQSEEAGGEGRQGQEG